MNRKLLVSGLNSFKKTCRIFGWTGIEVTVHMEADRITEFVKDISQVAHLEGSVSPTGVVFTAKILGITLTIKEE